MANGILGNAGFSASGHYDTSNMPLLIAKLTRLYRPDHEVVVYEAAVHIGCPPRITRVPLMYLAQVEMSAVTTLYIPPGMATPPDQHIAALAEAQQRHIQQHAQAPQYFATASSAQTVPYGN